MTGEAIWTLATLAACSLGLIGQWAAYRNGVADGYGYSKEPLNPGYQKAGKILKETSAHRWHELETDV